MSRPNKPRTIAAEDALRGRITNWRKTRGWSPAELARRMTEAGCHIQTSAIYKIENPDHGRSVTVDELVALGCVFGMAVGELLEEGADVTTGVEWALARVESAVQTLAATLREASE